MARIFSDPSVALYHTPGHPEAPFRVLRGAERLRAAGFRIEPPSAPAREEDLLAVHSAEHLRTLDGGDFYDPETPAYPGIGRVARVSLAGALSAMESALAGEPAFSLMRPPGHHAGRERIAGFCYLNNVAAAAVKALPSAGRVAVLDIDVHHGDGSEEILLGREGVLFCSLHQSPLYPGTGAVSRGNCLNVPLPAGADEAEYLRRLEPALRNLVEFKPGLLAVSAGFDTYKECPIAGLRLERRSYRRIGRLLAETGLRRFAVLEGGYAEALPEILEEFLTGFFG